MLKIDKIKEDLEKLQKYNYDFEEPREELMNIKSKKWCKIARKKMVDKDLKCKDIAKEIDYSRQYVSAIIYGRVYSEQAASKISNFLNIPDNIYNK